MHKRKRKRRRKCLHCKDLFFPDPRTRDRQKFCSKPECKRASKSWRQRRWLNKPENRDYFKGPENVVRVQEWRKAHPKYWRRKRTLARNALQDDCTLQPVAKKEDTISLATIALQDDCTLQPAVFVGLIANLIDSTLQDDIFRTLRKMHDSGQSILGTGPG